ncbi:family 43 glycosylhydrolase [Trichlorobacter sp.]|jgi:arabinan endo-1,5-alpha-L-arabinosidase|uniref:family 43 glycosylhydrolase n=1 Tax=Trichlorobacter sp. TaxID=2911007 RepID=UPI002A3693E7|nr:family 43 glycosylhydrolase [Trichlorobacter sp.]MDY0385425.1 family 43 glycosylhydrolase [Trichlorobacter sp.]
MQSKRILQFVVGITLLTSCQSSSFANSLSESLSSDVDSQVSYRENRYQNFVYELDFADPSVIRHDDGVFYAYATGGKIISSPDLVNWEDGGRAFESNPAWGTLGAGLWAPVVAKIQNQYVMYYSLSRWGDTNPGIGLATSPHPAGPWTDLGKLFFSDEIGVNNSIDPEIYQEDGHVYLLWGSFRGIYGIELTADGLGFQAGDINAAYAAKIHLAGHETSYGLDVSTFEAVNIEKIGEYYYMFVSSGECCSGAYSYHVKVGRATSIFGEYLDADARSMKNSNVGTYVVTGNSIFTAPGHNDVIIDDAGDYWLLYHAFPGVDRSRRALLIDRLRFNLEGWPSLFGISPTNNDQNGPRILA